MDLNHSSSSKTLLCRDIFVHVSKTMQFLIFLSLIPTMGRVENSSVYVRTSKELWEHPSLPRNVLTCIHAWEMAKGQEWPVLKYSKIKNGLN